LGAMVKAGAKGLAWMLARLLFGKIGMLRRLRRLRRRAPRPEETRSVLAIRLDLLGDLVFTLPAIEALKDAAPRSRLTVLVLPYTAALLKGHPDIDRVIAVDVNRWRRPSAWLWGGAWREVRRAVGELRSEPYDLCVSFYGRVGAAAALLSGARYLVGYASEGYLGSFDRGVPGRRYARRRHESEYCLDLVRALGISAAARPPRLHVRQDAVRRVDKLLADAGIAQAEKLVVLHPGALNMEAKRWLPERWAAVADALQTGSGRRVVLVGSPSEAGLAAEVECRMATPVVNLAGGTSLEEFVALLSRARLFLGGDSGPLHVASALGVPSVSVYGPTDATFTGPLHPSARVVRAPCECSPCYHPAALAACPHGDVACMARVSVDEVLRAVEDLG
jgi:heptosyltransferase II